MLARHPDVRDRAKSILMSETSRMHRLVQDLVEDSEQQPTSTGLSLQLAQCDLTAVAREQIEVATAGLNHHTIVLDAPGPPDALTIRAGPPQGGGTAARAQPRRCRAAIRAWRFWRAMRASRRRFSLMAS